MNEWVAIDQFLRPDSLAEAVALWQESGTDYISGGSRLAANRPEGVTSLISIRQLIHGEIELGDESAIIPAGSSIQELIDSLNGTAGQSLADCAQASCSSRNLRNQRTLGGELADGSFDSDLKVAFSALNPVLRVFEEQSEDVAYSDWNGYGIIERIQIPMAQLASLKTERFSLLPVSPAFLIVVSCDIEGKKWVAVGGAMDQVVVGTIESDLSEFNDTVSAGFRDDHFGSPEYKQQMLQVAFKRLGVIQ